MRESKIQYNPALTVKDNAKKNGVSEAAIRYYIKVNDLDRNFDRKQNIIADCRKYLKKNPKATRDEICEKTGHSLSTIRKYWEYISTEKELTDFNEEKAKKRQKFEEEEQKRQMTLLSRIPINVIEQYLLEHGRELKGEEAIPQMEASTEIRQSESTSEEGITEIRYMDGEGAKRDYFGVVRCSDKYAYFFEGVPFWNWWQSEPYIEYEGKHFGTSEQLFMYFKAIHFKDKEYAQQIVNCGSPRRAKALGRKVRGYSDKEWLRVGRDYMFKAIEAKYKSDKVFREALMSDAYRGKTFVEASPFDNRWGIKRAATDDVVLGKKKWLGVNLLGETLTKLRDAMLDKQI